MRSVHDAQLISPEYSSRAESRARIRRGLGERSSPDNMPFVFDHRTGVAVDRAGSGEWQFL
jgi:hypothetical protein